MSKHPLGQAPTTPPGLADDVWMVPFTPSKADLRILDAATRKKDFNPSEARDSHGRWRRIPHVEQVVSPSKNWLGRKMRMSSIRRKGYEKTPVTFLVSFSQNDAMEYGSANLGRLLVPGNHPDAKLSEMKGVPFAIDNGGFWGVPEKGYKNMIQEMHDLGVHPLWVTVPDVLHHNEDGSVIGDWKATAKRFEQWHQYLESKGMPSALVAQNGLETPEGLAWLDKHWNDIAAVFIGGDDDFKLGPGAAKITQLAHDHGKLVHVGRVNTTMRVDYVRDILQADSFDGQNWNRFKILKLEKGLESAPKGAEPPTSVGKRWLKDAYDALTNGTAWPKPPDRRSSPTYPRGFFPVTASTKADEPISGLLYYQPLADVLWQCGLSDDAGHLIFDDQPGFSVRYETPAQRDYFIASLGLSVPDIDKDNVASWARVLVVPGDPSDEPQTESLVKRFDPNQPRDGHGRWLDTPGGADGPMTAQAFHDIFKDFEHNGIHSKVTRFDEWPPRGGSIKLEFVDDKGSHVGYGLYDYQGESAHISRAFLNADVQNRGFATALHTKLFDSLHNHGLKRVRLEAVEVGSYAWAREGFHWESDKAFEQRRMLNEAYDRDAFFAAHRHKVPQELFDELDRKVGAGEFDSEAELAAFGRKYTWTDDNGRTMWLGKAVMLGGDWNGELEL